MGDVDSGVGEADGCTCILCIERGGRFVWESDRWRVVGVDDVDFPAFYRVVTKDHIEEFSLVPRVERQRCIELICAIEQVMIQALEPKSVNLASLGNVVPHLHWHVVARFEWDSHYPESIWGLRQRAVHPIATERLRCNLEDLDELIRGAIADDDR